MSSPANSIDVGGSYPPTPSDIFQRPGVIEKLYKLTNRKNRGQWFLETFRRVGASDTSDIEQSKQRRENLMDTSEDPMEDDNLSIALDQLESLTMTQCDVNYVHTPGEYDEIGVRILVDIAHSLRKLSGRGI